MKTRILEGAEEFGRHYFVGQKQRDDGCYENVTKKYSNRDLAEKLLQDWLNDEQNRRSL
jgi:hypothetical protein